MLEMMLGKAPVGSYYGSSGPGPKTLKYGTLTLGYFGTTTTTELFGALELGRLLNFTNFGVDCFTAGLYWFKFAYNGKILYVPNQQLKNFISWNDIYGAGLVYGTKSNGAYPATPAAWQHNVITKVEGPITWGFIPRLMTGWPDPTYPGAGLDAYPQSSNSEWQQLLGRVCTSGNGNIADKWDAQAASALSVGGTMASWTQETQATDVNKANSRGATYTVYAVIGSASNVKTYAGNTDAAWRPILELLPMDALLNPQGVTVGISATPQPPSILFQQQAQAPDGTPPPLLNPVNLIGTSSVNTKQPVIIDPTYPGGVLNPVNVVGSANVRLNPFNITAAPSDLVSDPANVVYEIARLNAFSISATPTDLVADPVNVVYSLAALNAFSISGTNNP
jgi:hypothetical protein